MNLVNEKYFAILLDRTTMGPLIIACSEGGTSIEDLAVKYPEKIIKVPVNINEGITDAQALKVAEGLEVSGDMGAAADQIKALYKLFAEADCTMVEVRGERERQLHTRTRTHADTRPRPLPAHTYTWAALSGGAGESARGG